MKCQTLRRGMSAALALLLVLSLFAFCGTRVEAAAETDYTHRIATGNRHSLAIDSSGTLWAWGNNKYGQLGTGDTEIREVPTKIMDDVAYVSAGSETSAAIKSDGSLWMWGLNQTAQLGNGAQYNLIVPSGNQTTDWHCQTVPVKIMDGIVAVSAAGSCTLAIADDGAIWGWGLNDSYQLGDNIGDAYYYSDAYSSQLVQTTPRVVLHDCIDVVAGSYALKANGDLLKCGGGKDDSFGWQVFMHDIKAITPNATTAVIKNDNSLWMWGSNIYSQLTGQSSFQRVEEPRLILNDVKRVAVSVANTAAIKTDGTLWMWGSNNVGEVGNGKVSDGVSVSLSVPVVTEPVKILDNVVAVSSGTSHSLALDSGGHLWVWGINSLGQLGLSDTRAAYYPTQLQLASFNGLPQSGQSNPAPSAKMTFADVKPTDYFADSVAWAIEKGVTNGTGKNASGQDLFSPNDTCTKAQIITFLWRSQGSPANPGASPFSDISYGSYYYDAAVWACINGIVPPGTFNPDEPCTRLSTVEFMWKLAGKPASASVDFDDLPTGDADAVSAVAWALANNVTNGTGGRSFGPDQICTRGQIVTFLYRAYA